MYLRSALNWGFKKYQRILAVVKYWQIQKFIKRHADFTNKNFRQAWNAVRGACGYHQYKNAIHIDKCVIYINSHWLIYPIGIRGVKYIAFAIIPCWALSIDPFLVCATSSALLLPRARKPLDRCFHLQGASERSPHWMETSIQLLPTPRQQHRWWRRTHQEGIDSKGARRDQ